jgi:hypothetical protein
MRATASQFFSIYATSAQEIHDSLFLVRIVERPPAILQPSSLQKISVD